VAHRSRRDQGHRNETANEITKAQGQAMTHTTKALVKAWLIAA
jgi:hypothetical protein